MEDLLMIWSSETPSLEALQPLSLSAIDEHEESIDLDKLTRSEIAGKLLDRLDQIADVEETEPFDWFGANEKPIDLPIFANISSAGIQNSYCKAGFQQSQYPYFDSPEYEPTTFVPTNYGFGGSAAVAGATQPQLMYAPPPFDAAAAAAAASAPISPTTTSIDMFAAAAATAPPDAEFVDCDPKREVLTPPESPKEQDLFRILEEMQTKDLLPPSLFDKRCENALLEANLTATRAMTTAFGPSGCDADADLSIRSTDDLSSDYAASSPSYECSESSSDNDADYVPRKGGGGGGASRRARAAAAAATTGGRKRATKSASRHSTEERRLRKKEQNKNAATRYRMKKKQEVEACKNEEQLLADRNRQLRNKLDDISREIKCLKSLMRDVYRKKGLIK